MALKIKICGITNRPDAEAAVEAGADALGFMFYEKSPRFLKAVAARDIIRSLPSHVKTVGVFVNATSCEVWETVELTGCNTLQFHGEESPEFCRSFNMPVLKAFRIKNEASLEILPKYAKEIWVLDSYVAGTHGGSGATFNWDLALKASNLGHPFFLAGGLTPENVAEAVHSVKPYGLDVSSGVEIAPGQKDHSKMRRFIDAVRNVKA